jgi:hypothetical protein
MQQVFAALSSRLGGAAARQTVLLYPTILCQSQATIQAKCNVVCELLGIDNAGLARLARINPSLIARRSPDSRMLEALVADLSLPLEQVRLF